MEAKVHYIGNQQVWIDPVLPPGTPDTVTLPVTGHVASLPHAELGETFVGYAGRVSEQLGVETNRLGDYNAIGALMSGIGSDLGATADPATWPLAADKFFNPQLYMTPEQIAKREDADKQWRDVYKKMGAPDAAAIRKQHQRIAHNRHSQPAAPIGTGIEVPIS